MSTIINRVINRIKKQYIKYKIMLIDDNSHKLAHFGGKYGGFFVDTDILKDKDNILVYSFGIGEDLSFSEALMEKYNCEIFAFDPTPKSIQFVNNHQLSKSDKFHFYPIGISDSDGIGQFRLPVNEDYVSGSLYNYPGVKDETIPVDLKRLKTIMADLSHDHIDVLKMDIEGSEFGVVTDILNSGINFEQLCVEVHYRFFKDGIQKVKNMIEELKNHKYELVSVSESIEELTFIKKES